MSAAWMVRCCSLHRVDRKWEEEEEEEGVRHSSAAAALRRATQGADREHAVHVEWRAGTNGRKGGGWRRLCIVIW